MSDNDSDFGSFLAGFVIGGLVGAAAALVLAPRSGAETRSKITGKGHDLVDASEQRYQQAVETVDNYAQEASDRAYQFGRDVEERARIILDDGVDSNGKSNGENSASSSTEDESEESAGE